MEALLIVAVVIGCWLAVSTVIAIGWMRLRAAPERRRAGIHYSKPAAAKPKRDPLRAH